jgi:formate C-acetyltransferase
MTESKATTVMADPMTQESVEFVPVTDRIQRFRDAVRNKNVVIDTERALIVTEAYKKYLHYPPILRKPLITKAICEQITVCVEDDELFVANIGKAGFNTATQTQGAGLFPDIGMISWIYNDIENGSWGDDGSGSGLLRYKDRQDVRLFISPEEVEKLYSIKEFWEEWRFGHSFDAWQPDGYKEFVRTELTEYWEGVLADRPSGHLTPGHHNIINRGYRSIHDKAQAFVDSHKGNLMGEDVAKYMFYYSIVIITEAAMTLVKRYAEAAHKKAEACTDPARKAELEMMADGLDNISENPARTYWEALQATILHQLLIVLDSAFSGISFGRVDQYSWPFLKQDLSKGTITLDQAQEMMDYFVMKTSNFLGAVPPFIADGVGAGNTFQHVTIGGVIPATGEDATNPVTFMVLQAMGRLHLHDPFVSLRIHQGSPKNLWDFAVKVTQEVGGLPLLQNDDVIIPGLMRRLDFSLEDARDYSIIGCQEQVGSGTDYPEGSGTMCGGAVLYSAIFVTALNNGTNPMNGRSTGCESGFLYEMESMDEVRAAVKKQLRYMLFWMTSANNYARWVGDWEAYHAVLSMGMDDCLERGADCTQGGARYTSYGSTAVGLSTVGDSLTAIKYMCFDKKICTTRELYDAMMVNWEGYEDLQQRVLHEVPHYGNDNEYADIEMKWIADTYIEICDSIYSTHTKHYKPGMYSAAAHIGHGMQTWATPDGRNTGTPLANSASAGQGREENGPIAMLNSAVNIDQSCVQNGMCLNLKIHPTALRGDGRDKLEQMTQAYFDNGGAELQFNIVSTDTMRAAQKNPEEYRDLVVRIAGYSAYFTELPPPMQNDLIARDEHML